MANKKLIGVTISAVLLLGVIFSAAGYHEYITRWNGETHGGCGHKGPDANASVNGTLVLSINETGSLAPLQKFQLTIEVLNFTEAIGDPAYERILICVPGGAGAGDNDKFSVSPGSKTMNRRERVDAYGSYTDATDGNADDDNVFELMAPDVAGTYELHGLALFGVNQSSDWVDTIEHAEVNITFVQDSITITVVAPTPTPTPEPTVPGYGLILITMFGGMGIVGVLLTLKRKRQIKE